jgi:hypothetical protein
MRFHKTKNDILANPCYFLHFGSGCENFSINRRNIKKARVFFDILPNSFPSCLIRNHSWFPEGKTGYIAKIPPSPGDKRSLQTTVASKPSFKGRILPRNRCFLDRHISGKDFIYGTKKRGIFPVIS